MWNLKETAKWSSNPEERKAAVQSLSARGEAAMPSLEEIMSVTAYEEVKAACIEAIKSVREKNADREQAAVMQSATAGADIRDLPP